MARPRARSLPGRNTRSAPVHQQHMLQHTTCCHTRQHKAHVDHMETGCAHCILGTCCVSYRYIPITLVGDIVYDHSDMICDHQRWRAVRLAERSCIRPSR